MNILALDLSLTRSGWAGPTLANSGVLVPPKTLAGVERLFWIRDAVRHLVRMSDLVILEGYAYGVARGNALTQLGELGGVIRLDLWEHSRRFVDVPPAVLKKYAAGKGNAKKEEVLVAAVKRLGYDGADHNVSDALWLLQAALDWYGRAVVGMPKDQRAALEKVKWCGASRQSR